MIWNSVKSLLGRKVNVHLNDGSVIVNVRVNRLFRDACNRKMVQVDSSVFPISSIAWMDKLSEVIING
jgi:hypothetical protein